MSRIIRVAEGPPASDQLYMGSRTIDIPNVSWKRLAIIAILAVEVIVLALLAFLGRGGPSSGVVVRGSDASIDVSPQRSVSTTITVDRAVAPAPSWIVVRVVSPTGGLGAVIGATHINSGVNIDVPVVVQPDTLQDEATAILVADRGVVGTLEYAGVGMGGSGGGSDVPYVADGSYVSATFTVQALTNKVGPGAAAIGSVTRSHDGLSVVASDVVAPGPSWLAVSAIATSGLPGAIVGEARVPQGVSRSIEVALPSAVATQPLTATLHVDLGQPGKFEYSSAGLGSGPDQPYVAGSQTVEVAVPPPSRP